MVDRCDDTAHTDKTKKRPYLRPLYLLGFTAYASHRQLYLTLGLLQFGKICVKMNFNTHTAANFIHQY